MSDGGDQGRVLPKASKAAYKCMEDVGVGGRVSWVKQNEWEVESECVRG